MSNVLYQKKERMKNMRSSIKKNFVMCFVMLVLAVVYSAPALAETNNAGNIDRNTVRS